MSDNILLRLQRCSLNPKKAALEEFTTEVMAFLANDDPVFRRIFVRHLVGSTRFARVVGSVTAKSQESFNNGRVDLWLEGRETNLLVEIKITAQESWTHNPQQGWVSQVRKYLSWRKGPVVYLSTRHSQSPTVRSRLYAGHRYFEDLYTRLSANRQSLTEIGKMFLDFMEVHHMAPVKPFTKADIRCAQAAFDFAAKCEDILEETMRIIRPQFKTIFRTKGTFTGAHFSPTYGSAYSWSKGFSRGPLHQFTVWIEPDDSELYLGVNAYVRATSAGKQLKRRVATWEDEGTFIYQSHLIKPGISVPKMAAKLLKDFHALRRALAKSSA